MMLQSCYVVFATSHDIEALCELLAYFDVKIASLMSRKFILRT